MYRNFTKKLIDVVIAVLLFPFWLIILLIIGPLIYFQDKGPVFYNAQRLGKNGEIFKMYKFRSMKKNAPDLRNEDGSAFNAEDDPRLTEIGKFIRKTSIDETPQLLNVIKGDMSFIGPRPDLPDAKELYSKLEKRKLEIRPGITGYNQAYYRNSVDQRIKFKNDLFYIDNISISLDVRILFKTLKGLLNNDNNIFSNK